MNDKADLTGESNPYCSPTDGKTAEPSRTAERHWPLWGWYLAAHFVVVVTLIPVTQLDNVRHAPNALDALTDPAAEFCGLFAVIAPFASLRLIISAVRHHGHFVLLAIIDTLLTLAHFRLVLALAQ